MNAQNGSPSKAAITQGVREAFENENYALPSGQRDMTKMRAHAFEVLRGRKVITWKERVTNAVTRGDLIEQVFPSLPSPETFQEQDDPQLAEAVWDEISSILWNETRVSSTSPLQRYVGLSMGNGYVLCRTIVSKNKLDAAYITDDVRCIEADFVGPDNQSLSRTMERVRMNREMLVQRQPQNARRYVKNFGAHTKAIQAANYDQLMLALEAAAPGATRDADDNTED